MLPCLFLAGLLLFVPAGHALDVHSTSRPFDYFMFVRQWAGTFCSEHNCPLIHSHRYQFTIHGLWPNYFDGSYPQFCDPKYDFHEDDLGDLISDLKSKWPTIFDDYWKFWEHEWSKHGTCALDVLPTEHSYFSEALDLHEQYDIEDVLKEQGFIPSDSKTYYYDDIVNALNDEFGVRPTLHCDGDGRITEVWMCVSRHFKAMECPGGSQTQCPHEVMIPQMHNPSGKATTVSEILGEKEKEEEEERDNDDDDDDDDDEKEEERQEENDDEKEDEDEEEEERQEEEEDEEEDEDEDEEAREKEQEEEEEEEGEEKEEKELGYQSGEGSVQSKDPTHHSSLEETVEASDEHQDDNHEHHAYHHHFQHGHHQEVEDDEEGDDWHHHGSHHHRRSGPCIHEHKSHGRFGLDEDLSSLDAPWIAQNTNFVLLLSLGLAFACGLLLLAAFMLRKGKEIASRLEDAAGLGKPLLIPAYHQ